MAIELTRRQLRSVMLMRAQTLRVPPRVLLALVALTIAVCFASVLVGLRDARRDERTANARLADVQVLLALPPVSSASLKTQLDQLQTQIAAAQATPDAVQVSDDLAAVLVRQAQFIGMRIESVARTTPAQRMVNGNAYTVAGVRVVVDGTEPQLVAYLSAATSSNRALVPMLNTATIDATGTVHGDLTFNTQSPAATATPASAGRTAAP